MALKQILVAIWWNEWIWLSFFNRYWNSIFKTNSDFCFKIDSLHSPFPPYFYLIITVSYSLSFLSIPFCLYHSLGHTNTLCSVLFCSLFEPDVLSWKIALTPLSLSLSLSVSLSLSHTHKHTHTSNTHYAEVLT